MKEIRTLLMVMVLSVLVLCGQASANLIVNGNFEGTDHFTTDYALFPGTPDGAQVYSIGKDPSVQNGAWTVPLPDSRPGAGTKMMIVNGSTSANKTVWQSENVCVKPHTKYVFSYWLGGTYPGSPATIQCSINGVVVGTATAPTGGWFKVSYEWNSGSQCKAVIRLVDTNLEYDGNDFAIDDIVFSAAPIAVIWGPCTGMVGWPLCFVACSSYDPDGCIVSYDWDWGDGDTGHGMWSCHKWAAAGTYTVTLTVTDKDGLTGTATASITISKLLWCSCF
jgi:hypothetical protein